MKKILFVWPYPPSLKSAATTRLMNFYKNFNKKYKVQILVKNTTPNKKSNLDSYKNSLDLFLKIKKINPDIIISSTPTILLAFLSTIISKILGIKCIVDVRDPYIRTSIKLGYKKKNAIKTKMLNILEILTYRLSFKLSVVLDIKDILIKEYNISKEKIIVVPNGVETNNFFIENKEIKENIRKELKINKNDIVIVYQGIIAKEKELNIFLEELAKKKLHQKFKLKILFLINYSSENIYTQEIRKILSQYSLNNEYIEVHNLNKSQLRKHLNAADIAINPLSDVMDYCVPVKTFEYYACGLPVLSKGPKNGGLHKLYEKHNIGEFNDNWKETIFSLEKMLKNFKKAKKKYNTKREEFLKKYSRDKIAKDFMGKIKNE